MQENIHGGGVFTVQCHDKDGNLKWEVKEPNLVMNAGLQDMNNKYFSGSGYTAGWYLGLISGTGPSIAGADTLASHAGWTEIPVTTGYSGNRKSVTFGSATSASPSAIVASAASFAMLDTYVVSGAFLCTVASGTSGILFSASEFESPGDRTVVTGDTLNVTYAFNLTAS